MSELVLKSLDITNFRSIRGHIHAPLDAKVILVHGENGAGKTSLLSALELSLTGGIQSLQRADPAYTLQLLHRSADEGSITVKTTEDDVERLFSSYFSKAGVTGSNALHGPLAAFFRERCFLPQSLLGQLLQIYQDSGNDADSPLARFVGTLLGLDRLDALELGLRPFADIRNVRKNVDGWVETESEKTRRERIIADLANSRKSSSDQIAEALKTLLETISSLGLDVAAGEDTLDAVELALDPAVEASLSNALGDQQRQLGAIVRELSTAQGTSHSNAPGDVSNAGQLFGQWESQYGKRLTDLRSRLEKALADFSTPSDFEQIATSARPRMALIQKQLSDRIALVRTASERISTARQERDVAKRQLTTVDEEIGQLPATAGSLASALAELSSYIMDDICPVCDRNYAETETGSLADHVHGKVRSLSASADRLLVLGRSRSELQVSAERLDREMETLEARVIKPEALADLERQSAEAVSLAAELESFAPALQQGGRLRADDIAARRQISEQQSTNASLAAARGTVAAFAVSVGADPVTDSEPTSAALDRLGKIVSERVAQLNNRLALRRRGVDLVSSIRTALVRRKELDATLSAEEGALRKTEHALETAQNLREEGNAIRNAVDKVRSAIIRREFNDRLNRLWRDLFVRLAPGEPFIPAFRIPESATQRLQPKLITEHREGGDAGGTPGAMLSAGNLNTAALTLFISLHLSVQAELPWLILDDPVQSMDDVHIAHFAALLRTLSKEHGRQIMIAVHDRQLFEYLRLELSPAFPDDSLLTLELSRGPRRDSLCEARRLTFHEETALSAVA